MPDGNKPGQTFRAVDSPDSLGRYSDPASSAPRRVRLAA